MPSVIFVFWSLPQSYWGGTYYTVLTTSRSFYVRAPLKEFKIPLIQSISPFDVSGTRETTLSARRCTAIVYNDFVACYFLLREKKRRSHLHFCISFRDLFETNMRVCIPRRWRGFRFDPTNGNTIKKGLFYRLCT